MPPISLSSTRVLVEQVSIPEFVDVQIEVPRGSFVKRKPNGDIDIVGPVPCPFNYGSVPSMPAPDGDPLDAIILGPQLPYGHKGTWRVKGIVKFMDAGCVDNKLVCVQQSPSRHFSKIGLTSLVTAIVRQQGKEERVPPSVEPSRTSFSCLDGSHGRCGSSQGGFMIPGLGDGLCHELKSRDGHDANCRLSIAEYALITSFFSSYAIFKTALNCARGKHGRTSFEGWEFPH